MSVDMSAMQGALAERGLDGWLFYDFRGSDPLAYSILGLAGDVLQTRRWFYYMPAVGTPTKIVHAIELGALDALPGEKRVYLPWRELESTVADTLSGARRVAMQYSPGNAIPTISRVDAGTIEFIRSLGVSVESSADLVQLFEATLSDRQYASHVYAADVIAQICSEAFDEIGRRLRDREPATEYLMQQFIVRRFEQEGLISEHPPIVAVDAHSADPHFSPSPYDSTPIRPGQTVLIDLWAKRRDVGSIYADITRVAYIGSEVPAEYTSVFSVVRRARDAAVDAVRRAWAEGRSITGAHVDDVCRCVIEDAGYGSAFIHRTGHSIQQSDHGNGANIDNLETRDDRTLIPMTLFSIEPGIYLTGKFGIRSEINVYLSGQDVIVTGPEPQMHVHRIDVT